MKHNNNWKDLIREVKDAKKDSEFRKEIKEFVRLTTN